MSGPEATDKPPCRNIKSPFQPNGKTYTYKPGETVPKGYMSKQQCADARGTPIEENKDPKKDNPTKGTGTKPAEKAAPARKKSSTGRVPETNNYIARINQAWEAGPVKELKIGTLTVRKATQFSQIRTLDLDAFGSLLEKIQVALKNSTRYQIDKIIELLKNKGLSPEKVAELVKAGLEGDALIKAVLEAMGEKPDALLTDAAKADEANKKAQELKQAKEAAEAKKKAAEETAAKKQQAAQLIQQLSISPLAKDEVYRNNPDLLILSGEINLGQRIIYFQEGEGNQKKEMIALIKWNEGERRWQVAGRPGYTVDNTEGKLTLKKDSGSLFKRKLEATLVVDSAWKRMKAMGVSYTDYQQIFADERVTWDEFKKIKDATREAYNFWSWGGIVNKDGDEGISASDMEMVFQNHINKVSEGLGENQKTQIIRAYVVAKYFVIVPAEQVAKKLMEGKDHLSAAELLAAVGPNLTKSTAMQVIRNIVNDPVLNGNLSFENISLNKAQVERFIATMGFLAQVEVAGYKVDTSTLRDKSALKEVDNVLAWLKGEEPVGGNESGTGATESKEGKDIETQIKDAENDGQKYSLASNHMRLLALAGKTEQLERFFNKYKGKIKNLENDETMATFFHAYGANEKHYDKAFAVALKLKGGDERAKQLRQIADKYRIAKQYTKVIEVYLKLFELDHIKEEEFCRAIMGQLANGKGELEQAFTWVIGAKDSDRAHIKAVAEKVKAKLEKLSQKTADVIKTISICEKMIKHCADEASFAKAKAVGEKQEAGLKHYRSALTNLMPKKEKGVEVGKEPKPNMGDVVIGDLQQAVAILKDILEKDPENEEVQEMLLQSYDYLFRFTQSKEELLKQYNDVEQLLGKTSSDAYHTYLLIAYQYANALYIRSEHIDLSRPDKDDLKKKAKEAYKILDAKATAWLDEGKRKQGQKLPATESGKLKSRAYILIREMINSHWRRDSKSTGLKAKTLMTKYRGSFVGDMDYLKEIIKHGLDEARDRKAIKDARDASKSGKGSKEVKDKKINGVDPEKGVE